METILKPRMSEKQHIGFVCCLLATRTDRTEERKELGDGTILRDKDVHSFEECSR
ncbi:hypothetical protein L798_13677 [Zootermopsis nevadensis]|uniref:Uncharacterized protein n=1 Tax=Zootermopsis nevadensis TaxID=136037 RepID=A0A067QQS2_ZOONE|nr:hypothetical protein L798_13677 [Zootermopsis nevadensis]